MSDPCAASEPTDPAGQPLAFRVVRGALWVAASSYFTIGFGFAANLVLTRLLNEEAFGIFALAGFFYSLCNLRPKLGIGLAFAKQPVVTGDLIGTHLTLDIGAGLGSLALTALALPLLGLLGYPSALLWATVALAGAGLLDAVMGTAWILLDKNLEFRQSSLITSVAFPLSYAPAFWLAIHGAGYWSLVSITVTYAALLLVGMWWAARRHVPIAWQVRWQFDRKLAFSLLRYGTVLGFAEVAAVLLTQFDNFLVGTFVGLAALGFYDRAYRIAQWPNTLLSNIITRAAFYTYAHLQDDPLRLSRTVTMAQWLTAILGWPLALVIFVSAPDLVILLYGERWLPSAVFIRFLVVYSAARPILDNAGSLFAAVGRARLVTLTVLFQAIILIAAGVPLTLALGAVGTAEAVGLAFGTGLILRLVCQRQVVAVPIGSTLLIPALAALACGTGGLILASWLGHLGWPLIVRLSVQASASGLGYLACLFAFQPRETRGRIAYVARLLRRRAAAEPLADGPIRGL